MKKIIFLIMIVSIIISSSQSCKKATPQLGVTTSTQPNKDIQQVKDFFDQLKNKKKTRTTISLSDDSLVYYIEADLNIKLGNFTYDKDVLTTETVEVAVPYSTTGYNSTEIEAAVATMQTAMEDKYDDLDVGTNSGLVLLYVDVELIETTSTHKKLRGMGVYGVDVDVDAYTRCPECEYRCWPKYCTAADQDAKGYCTDYTQGIRISNPMNDIPGWMSIVDKQKYVNIIFPNGLPPLYQYIAINITPLMLTAQPIASNPYRPSMLYNQFSTVYSTGVCFGLGELDFYMDLCHSRITSEVSQTNKSYLDHWWHTGAVCPTGPGGIAVAGDYYPETDYVSIRVGKLVHNNQ